MRQPAIESKALVRKFGYRTAIAGISFELHNGECLAVFGPNGAGKTTLLRVLAGVLRPSAGEARIGGVLMPGDASARGRVGFVGHASMLYSALTAAENVVFAARIHGVHNPAVAASAALERMGAHSYANRPVRLLSRGQQQRVSIARATVHSPDVLLLDEPYSGLDETGSRKLTALLTEQRNTGSTLVVVTHNIAEGLALATQSAIMVKGAFARTDARNALDAAQYPAIYHELVAHGE